MIDLIVIVPKRLDEGLLAPTVALSQLVTGTVCDFFVGLRLNALIQGS